MIANHHLVSAQIAVVDPQIPSWPYLAERPSLGQIVAIEPDLI